MSEEMNQGKKGRPTPKRRDAERKHQRPLVASKKSMTKEERKEAKARQRRVRDEMYAKRRAALEGRGDERYLPAQDQGKDRRFVRDYVDARWSFSEFLMPFMIIMLVVSLIAQPLVKNALIVQIPLIGMYGAIFIAIIEMVVVSRKVKRLVRENFNIAQPKTGFYTAMRMLSIRPWRSPRPVVKRGEFPRGARK